MKDALGKVVEVGDHVARVHRSGATIWFEEYEYLGNDGGLAICQGWDTKKKPHKFSWRRFVKVPNGRS